MRNKQATINTIDLYDYFFENPLFFDMDFLGPNSELVDNLDQRYDCCIVNYDDSDKLEEILKKFNVSCEIIEDHGELLGFLFKTEQDKLAFILKIS